MFKVPDLKRKYDEIIWNIQYFEQAIIQHEYQLLTIVLRVVDSSRMIAECGCVRTYEYVRICFTISSIQWTDGVVFEVAIKRHISEAIFDQEGAKFFFLLNLQLTTFYQHPRQEATFYDF